MSPQSPAPAAVEKRSQTSPPGPLPDPPPNAEAPSEELRRLGEELTTRTDDVVSCMASRSADAGVLLDTLVEERFKRVGAVSTIAVARWMAGEGADVAREVGQESWGIF